MNARADGLVSPARLPVFASLYWLTILVVVLVGLDVLLWSLGNQSLRSPFGWNLSFIAAIVGGARFIYHAVMELLEGRLGTDAALAIALAASLVLNEYWVAAEVVLIALVGESLEAITFRRTQRELRKLLELQPRIAHVRIEDGYHDVDVGRVRAGDVVMVRPGERVPVDGMVIAGCSAVDQSTLTGESVPVDKEAGNEVFAGTLNQLGALEVRVVRIGGQSTLGQILNVVTAARKNKADVERLADRLTRYFLPVVLCLAAATFVATNGTSFARLIGGDPVRASVWQWMPTLAVLVVACPCALVLATPAAVLAALAWLARRGAVVTGGAALERLASVTHFAFDKTGTLTQGKLRVAACVGLGGTPPVEVLRIAAAAEQASEHLLGQAIRHAAQQQQLSLPSIAEFESRPGAGVLARVENLRDASGSSTLVVGNRQLMIELGTTISPQAEAELARLENAGLTPLLVQENSSLVGVIGVGDTVRPEAASLIQELRTLGIEEFVILSGDRPAAVRQVAQAVGIDRYVAELRPRDKANWIADWGGSGGDHRSASRRSRARNIAMVGDGVNDAPALATADVGIALRSVGSEFAAEAGDVILLGDPLRPLPGVVRMARETVRVIRQNVVIFAFAVNFLGIAITAWIMPAWSDTWRQRAPVAAALFHQVGSVLVLLNAMRLLWFERWQSSRIGRIERWAGDMCTSLVKPLTPVADIVEWAWRLRGTILRLVMFAALLTYLAQIFVFVQPDEVAVVKRFGRVHAVLRPGPHLRLPPPFDSVTREQPARVRTIELGLRTASDVNPEGPVEWSSTHEEGRLLRDENDSLVLTGDRSLVELAVAVQYTVADITAFRFGVRDAEELLRVLAESVVREVVAAHPLLVDSQDDVAEAEILTRGRRPLESKIHQRLQQRADELSLGISILPRGVCLQDVHPPLAVVDAFRDVSSAFKEHERMKNEGDAYRREQLILAAGETAWRTLRSEDAEVTDEQWNELRPTLAGEAFTELSQAEAFSVDRSTVAVGDAQAFLDQYAALQANPALTRWRMYMDTIAAALSDKRKLLLDTTVAGRRHLLFGSPDAANPALWPPPQPPLQPDDE